MNKSKISSYFIFIAFFTFISIFLTIIQTSYNNLMNPIKQVEENKLLEPLNPVLDSEIIQEIEKRQIFDENEELLINNNSDSDQKQTISPSPYEVPISVTPQNDIQPIPKQEENN